MQNGMAIHMLTEKKYPLSQEMMSKMLKKRLKVDHESAQAFELLRIDQGVGSTSGIRACALRNFDLGKMELENSQNNALAKLPMLKLGEYEMWEIRIKQYFQIQDYALWEVIENGNSWVPIPVTTPESGPSTVLKMTVPSTTEEKICKKNDVKARSLLLMALPNEHQLTFNQYVDAQSMLQSLLVKIELENGSKVENALLSIEGKKVLPQKLKNAEQNAKAKDNRNWNQGSSSKAVRIEDASEKAMCAIDGAGFDWSDMAEDEIQANMALMAFTDSEVSNDKSYDTGFKAATYKRGLSILEAQVVKYKESEVLFSEEIALLKRSVGHKEYLMGLLKTELEKVKEEKEGFEFKIAKFEKSSKDLDQLLASNLEEFKQPEVNEYSSRDSSLKPTTICDREVDNSKESSLKVDKDWKEKFFYPANHAREVEPKQARENNDAPIIEDWVSDDEEEVEVIPKVEKKTAIPTATKKESVKPEKPIRRSISSIFSDFKEFDEGYCYIVEEANGGKLQAKGTIKIDNLILKDVYFVKELKFNRFSVSQCDKKNYVLFTDSECLVLSPNFKLPDENQILLKIPRQNNMYSFDMKNIVPKDGLTCLVAKATSEESIEKGIKREYSVARTPQQNGVAERKNRTLIEAARTMLADSKLPTTIWQEAVSTACYASMKPFVKSCYNSHPSISWANVDGKSIQGVSESSTSSQQDQDCIVMPIWKDASYFDDASRSIFNTASPEVNTGSREVSTAVPEINTATPEDLMGPIPTTEDTQVEDQEIELGNISPSYENNEFSCHSAYKNLQRSSKLIIVIMNHFDLPRKNCEEFESLMKDNFQMSSRRTHLFLGLQHTNQTLSLQFVHVASDYAGATLDRKSTTGGCQFLGNRLISWQCKKQTVVATSITEAEYVAAASCCGQSKRLLEKDFLNPLIVDSLLKTIWSSMHHVFNNEALASPKQTAIGKDLSNPFIVDSLLKTIWLSLHHVLLMKQWLVQSKRLLHNMVAFLEKSTGSAGFHQIIDFLNQSHISYALTKKPEVCVSFIKQFWRSTEASNEENGEVKINAIIDGHSLSITEGSLRRHLKLANQDVEENNQGIYQDKRLLYSPNKIGVLEADLMKTKKTYSSAYTKLILRVKKLEAQIKVGKARRQARVVLSDTDVVEDDSSKQGRKFSDEGGTSRIMNQGNVQPNEIRPIFEKIDTQEELQEPIKDLAEKSKKFRFFRKTTKERQKLEEDAEKDELKGFLDIVPREEAPIEIESIFTKFPIVDWKTCVLTKTFMYYQVFRGDGSSKKYKVLSEMLEDFDRLDVEELFRLVKERYSTSRREGFNLMLWGDLHTLFEPDKDDEIWRDQHEYNLLSERLCDFCGIHILLMDNGMEIHMLIEKKYPLSQEMLTKMLSKKLEVEHESSQAFELLRPTVLKGLGKLSSNKVILPLVTNTASKAVRLAKWSQATGMR
ncbi:ribonuclease H-like domain-containing protein [Tanacetum coccineum]